MKYKVILFYFLLSSSMSFSQLWNKKIDSVYQHVDREDIDSLMKSYDEIFSYMKNMSYNSAVQVCEELKSKTSAKKDSYFEELLAGNYLAWLYAKRDKEKALAEYFNLINIIPKMNLNEQAHAYYYAGRFHISIGMPKLGAKYLLKAIDAFMVIGNHLKLFQIHFVLADTYYKTQLYRKTINEMQQALHNYHEIVDSSERLSLSNGRMYLSAYNTIALSYEKLGMPDSAQAFYKKAKQIAIESNNSIWQNIINGNMGHIYMINKNYDSAEITYKKTVLLSTKYKMISSAINNMIALAEVYMRTGRIDSAAIKLEECYEYALRHKKSLPIAYYRINSEVNEKKGDFEKALSFIKRYHFIKDSIKNIALSNKMSNISLEHSLEKERSRLEELEVLNKIDHERLTAQNSIIVSLMAILVVLTILFVIYFRDRKRIRNLNNNLKSINEKLIISNKELNVALKSLKATQTQLLQNEKMASLGILTAGVAHEINNPLNYIMGAYVGLNELFKGYSGKNKKEIGLFLRSMDEGIKRISRIVVGLNHFSRDSSNYDEECDIHSILDNCISLLESTLKHRIDVQKEYSGKSMTIRGNMGKLHQAFFNILLNSIQAIKNNGIITIKTFIDSGKVSVCIKDNGCGISKENIKRILVPFFTTKAPGKGVGLGLSISYSIIKDHNGMIVFSSDLGKGTTVTISFTQKINTI